MNMKRKENFQMLSKELQLKIRSHKCTTRFSSPCQKDTRKKKFNLLFVDHQRCHEFEPSTTKDTQCRERCTLNLSRAQTSSCWSDVVVKRGQFKRPLVGVAW
ncbi:hypothetical protein TNCV_990791 [Trichonephila clavipes]|nr:hypothetical protein TNCV_990791 [Trichonephila clavipes]